MTRNRRKIETSRLGIANRNRINGLTLAHGRLARNRERNLHISLSRAAFIARLSGWESERPLAPRLRREES